MAVKEKKPSKSRAVSKKEFDAAMKRIDAHTRNMDVNLRKIRALDRKMAPKLKALEEFVKNE